MDKKYPQWIKSESKPVWQLVDELGAILGTIRKYNWGKGWTVRVVGVALDRQNFVKVACLLGVIDVPELFPGYNGNISYPGYVWSKNKAVEVILTVRANVRQAGLGQLLESLKDMGNQYE